MGVEVVAIFVACQINLVICHDLPFIRSKHVFETMDVCKASIGEIAKKEATWRKEHKLIAPIVMGKCKLHLRGN